MPYSVTLPGVVARPLSLADAPAVFELTRAAEIADLGHSMVELEDIRGDWSRPSYVLGEQSLALLRDDALVAYGELHHNRLEAYVHPAHRGEGIGTALFGWALAKGRELGYPRVGQTVPVSNGAAIDLFTRHEAQLLYTSWILQLPADTAIAGAELPPGHRMREFDAGRDAHAVYETIESAFNEWPDRAPTTFEDWQARSTARGDFEPWQVITVVEQTEDGEHVVGACLLSVSEGEGWVDQIAVRRGARGRGLGRALLVSAFDVARSRGATTSRLNTDSRTGALGLYEHVGMVVAETYRHYSVDLRLGVGAAGDDDAS